jgi:signal transduction histidine kinase
METIKIQAVDSDDAYETSGLTNYQLDEVLSEFVDNSISASNGPHVTVTIKVFIDGETAKLMVIEDNGKGIAEEDIPKVIALGQ